jgi:hypothetical protein
VSEQVSQVVDDPRAAAGLRRADLEVNPNAIELAKERIGGLNEGIDTAIEEYFDLLADREADHARERAKIEAYNRHLASKNCRTIDIEAELARPPEGPKRY